QVGQQAVSGHVARGEAPVTLIFDPVPGVYPGGRFFGAPDGPDRLKGYYLRGNSFFTEATFLRGEHTFDAPSAPALTATGLEDGRRQWKLNYVAAMAATRRDLAPSIWISGAPQTITGQLFRMAHLTKPLTGTLAGRLVEQ